MTIKQALDLAIKLPDLDSEVLLLGVLEKNRAWMYGHMDYELTKSEQVKFKRYIRRRAKGEPVAYILGHKEFYGLDFLVDKNILIPRPETELMVEEVLKEVGNKSDILLIDVGTGSGCILISIVKKTKIRGVGIDISKKALDIAKKNAKKHGVDKRVKFLESNLLEKISCCGSKVILTANLPYLSNKIYKKNHKNLKYEPKQALVANKNGLELYEKLLKQIPKGWSVYLEIDPRQKNKILKLNKQAKIKKDLAGLDRLVVLKT